MIQQETVISVATNKVSARRAMGDMRAPMTYDNLMAMAQRYEKRARSYPQSINPPTRMYIGNLYRTARALYSLARDAQS